jgi:xanthine/uracil permease
MVMIPSNTVDLIWARSESSNLDLWANLILLGIAALAAYLVLQLLVVFRCDGRWRILALLPPVVTAPVLGYVLLQMLTGADLWLLGLIYVMPPASLYLAVIGMAHGLMRARRYSP